MNYYSYFVTRSESKIPLFFWVLKTEKIFHGDQKLRTIEVSDLPYLHINEIDGLESGEFLIKIKHISESEYYSFLNNISNFPVDPVERINTDPDLRELFYLTEIREDLIAQGHVSRNGEWSKSCTLLRELWEEKKELCEKRYPNIDLNILMLEVVGLEEEYLLPNGRIF